MEDTVERLPTKKEEKTIAFYVCHPCYCFQEVFKTFLKCLGIESKEEKEEENLSTSLLKPHACASDHHPIEASEDHSSSSSSQKSPRESGHGVDPPSTTIQTVNITSSMGRGGPRRSPPSQGRGGGTN